MNTPLKITLGILGAAALVGVGVMIGKTWSNAASEPAHAPYRFSGKTGASAHSDSQETPEKPRYRATTIFQVNQSSAPDVFSNVSKEIRDSMSGTWPETQFKSLTAQKTLLRTVKNLNLDTAWKRSPADAASRLKRLIKAEHERGTDIFILTAWSDEPDEAVAIANGVRDAYEQLRRDAETSRLRRLSENVAAQIKQQQTAVEKARLEMLDLMKRHKIVDLTPFRTIGQAAAEIPDVVRSPDAAEIKETIEAPSETGIAELVADRQKQAEYATAKNRYLSQVQLLGTVHEHGSKPRLDEAVMQKPIEILEPAVAIEDQ